MKEKRRKLVLDLVSNILNKILFLQSFLLKEDQEYIYAIYYVFIRAGGEQPEERVRGLG